MNRCQTRHPVTSEDLSCYFGLTKEWNLSFMILIDKKWEIVEILWGYLFTAFSPILFAIKEWFALETESNKLQSSRWYNFVGTLLQLLLLFLRESFAQSQSQLVTYIRSWSEQQPFNLFSITMAHSDLQSFSLFAPSSIPKRNKNIVILFLRVISSSRVQQPTRDKKCTEEKLLNDAFNSERGTRNSSCCKRIKDGEEKQR